MRETGTRRIRYGRGVGWLLIWLAVPAAWPQLPGGGLWMRTSEPVQTVAAAPGPGGEVLRTIDDPHTGARWLLLRNDAHPEGPGVLVLAAPGTPALGSRNQQPQPMRTQPLTRIAPLAPPLVRSGQTIRVYESTPVLDAVFEAVAVGNADLGHELMARLTLGGRLVRVRVTAAGQAEFLADAERRP